MKIKHLLSTLLVLGMLVSTPVITSSCTSWKSTTHQTVGTVAITGDAAMQAWAAYVHSGQATQEQERNVRAAYERYQASMNAIIDVGKSATTSTNRAAIEIIAASAVAAQSNLVQLINAFTK